jgi:hypothetical protein
VQSAPNARIGSSVRHNAQVWAARTQATLSPKPRQIGGYLRVMDIEAGSLTVATS